MLHRTIIGIVLIMLGSVNAPLQAQVALPNSPTAVELAALPRECRSKVLGRASPQLEAEWNLYEARHGREVWLHYHHYCFALNFMNRTPLASLKKDKRYNLGRAIGNFDYVLRHWPPNTPPRPLAENGKRQAEFMIKLL